MRSVVSGPWSVAGPRHFRTDTGQLTTDTTNDAEPRTTRPRRRLRHLALLLGRAGGGFHSDHHPHPQPPAVQDGHVGGDGLFAAGDEEEPPPPPLRAVGAAGDEVPAGVPPGHGPRPA